MSSVLEWVRLPVTPSATVAERRLSMAPSTAMVKAEGSRRLMVAMLSSSEWGSGMSVGSEPKRSPMVSTASHGHESLSRATMAVTIMMASSAPGSFLLTLGARVMIRSDTTPTARVGRSMLPRLDRYMPHLGMNSLGTPVSPRPKKSLIWVEKMVSAIPAVNPTTIG